MSNQLKQKLSDLREECESLKSQLIRYEKETEIRKSEISSLKETNEELTNKLNSSTDKIQQISAQLNSYNDLNNKFEEINAKNITLNKQIIEYKEQIKHYESQNKELLQQTEDYKLKSAQNIRLNKSNNKLLETHKQTELTQSSKIKELQDQIQILNSELRILKSMPSPDDDEKAHKVNVYALPALQQNDTLKVKVRSVFSPTDDIYVNKNEAHIMRQGSVVSTTSVVTPAKTYNHIIGYNQFSPLSNSDETNVNIDANITSVGGLGTMYYDQSIVSTTSTVGGTVLVNGYDKEYQAMILQLKQKHDEEIKMLIEKLYGEFDEKIKKINEKNDNEKLKNEIENLKRENSVLKQRVKNAWEIRCVTPSWFNNDVDD